MNHRTGTDAEQRLRLAFSYRDKARLLLRNAERAAAAEPVDQAQFDRLCELYKDHLRRAETLIRNVRKGQRRRLKRLEGRRRALRQKQLRLSQRVTAARIRPKRANRDNRRLAVAMAHCDTAISGCSRLLVAENPDAVGGLLDLPLDRYAMGARTESRIGLHLECFLAFCIAAGLALTVFLPWLSIRGDTRSLYDVGMLFPRLGVTVSLMAAPVRFLWVAYALGPVAAMPFIGLGRTRVAGLGLIMVGVAVLSSFVISLFALGFYAGGFAGLGHVFGGLRSGALMYGGGSALLILYGFRQLALGGPARPHGVRKPLVAAWAVAALPVIAVTLMWLALREGQVTVVAHGLNARKGFIEITCRNTGTDPVIVYVPWPDGTSDNAVAAAKQDTYGVAVYVRERGQSGFQLFPASEDYWSRRGTPLGNNRVFEVEPRMTLTLRLNLRRVRDSGTDPDAVRLVFSRGDGSVVRAVETEMP